MGSALLVAVVWSTGYSVGVAQEPRPKSSGASKNLEAEILLGAARNAIRLGKTQTAIERFERLLKNFPEEDQGRLEYAGLLFQMHRLRQAQRQYAILLKKRPNDLELVRAMVDILLTTGDLPRARAFLEPVVKSHPDRTDFALELAKIEARDGDLAAARQIVRTRIQGRPLATDRMRIDAVELFTQMKRADLAREPLETLLRTRPDDPRVMAARIRYELLLGRWSTAFAEAEKFDRRYPKQHGLLLELASDLYAAQYYTEAGKIFDRVLKTQPQNQIALLGNARIALRYNRLRQAWTLLERVPEPVRGRSWSLVVAEAGIIAGKYRQSHEILEKLLRENSRDRTAAMAMADLNRAQHEFVKADCGYWHLGAEQGDQAAALHLARSLAIQKRSRDAESLCRTVLQQDPNDADAMLLLGEILGERGQLAEAVQYLEKAGKLKHETLPEYVYYRYRLTGEPAEGDLLAGAKRPLYSAAVIYSLAMRDGRRDLARRVLDAGLRIDSENLVLKTHQAEWYASYGTVSCAATASQHYQALLCVDPDNQKWLLGLARSQSTRRCYDGSLSLYARLRCEQPTNYLIAREQARVATSVLGTHDGQKYYDSAIRCWPGMEEERRRLCLERTAKADHVPRPTSAAACYRKLIALEPSDSYFRFELGQAYGAVGSTRCAIGSYQHLLSLDPNHRDAKVALEGKWLDLQDRVFADYQFQRERGRDGLTSIDRGRALVGVRHIYENEDEFLAVAYGRLNLAPTLDTGTPGNAVDVQFQRRLPCGWFHWLAPGGTPYFFVDGGVEMYDRFVSTRPVGLAGLRMRTYNDWIWTVAGSMDNILENHESLRQDVYRGGALVGLQGLPVSFWELGVNYRYDAYSDKNNRHAIELRNRIKLTNEPRQWSLLMNMDYWNFAQSWVFQPGPDPYTGMLHPYFSPQDFLQADVGLEYKRWLGRGPQPGYGHALPCRLVAPGLGGACDGSRYGDRFDGADVWWISFSARKRWDSEDKNYTILNGALLWDITRRLTGYARAEYLESSVYRNTSAQAGLSWIY
ncbi:MAG: tetratricopeptide repeat protein [Planctomycetia bacterium]